jgi:hypothetical protein
MRLVLLAVIAATCTVLASPVVAQVTYVDATPTPGGNTTRIDGSNWTFQALSNIDNLWRTRGAGNGNGDTIAEAGANGAENAHMLVTTIPSLTPNVQYRIFGYFWSQVASSTQDWKLKATIDPAVIVNFGTPSPLDDFLPTVTPLSFSEIGSATAPLATNAPALAETFDGTDNLGVTFDANNMSTSYFTTPTKIKQADNSLAMFQASLGIATADATGHVKVYIDDLEGQTSSFRTWYDGVGYSVVTSPTLTINRSTGAMVFNTGFERDIIGYQIKSPSGTLNQGNWHTIAGHYDNSPGADGSIDDNDTWLVLSNPASKTDLSEAELGLGGPLDGALLNAGTAINFGTPWQKHFNEDVTMELLLNDTQGTIENVIVTYTGNGGLPYQKGDFNFDGVIGPADYAIFIGSFFEDITGSIADAYALGDLTSDIAVGYDDLLQFRDIYDIANGAGAFQALMVGVPEPGGLTLVACVGVFVLSVYRRRGGAKVASAFAIATLLLVSSPTARAQTFYVDATETLGGNTTKLDGSSFVPVTGNLADGLWRKRVFGNSGTIFETNAGGAEDGHMLVTTISGLVPSAQYNIYSYFWSNPNENWRLKATTNLASVNTNDTVGDLSDDFLDNDPSVAFSANGSATTTTAPLAQSKHFGTPTLIKDTSTSPNLLLYEAVLGTATADATGKVKVYLDDLEDQGSANNRTFYDGVGFERIQPLTLEVNTVSGFTRIINNSGAPIAFNFYQITSEMNSLNAAGWKSLDVQNFDAVDGADVGTIAGDSQLEGWDAAGGSDDDKLGEVRFLSSSTFANLASRGLGYAFDPGGQQDLVFTFEIGGRVRSGVVQYVNAPPLPGDYDRNGIVQLADYTLWRSTFGSGAILDADGNGNHAVDAADYVIWRKHYTAGGSGSGMPANLTAVPEPATAVMFGMAAAIGTFVCARRRNSCVERLANSGNLANGFASIRNDLVNRMNRQICLRAVALLLTAGISGSAAAAVFPNPGIPQNSDSGTNRTNGVKRALYSVVHDVNDPFTPAEWTSRVATIRSKELATREFYAENSGGKFDIYYDEVIDVPITLNADGTRPANWVTQSDAVATGTYGLTLSNYYIFAYDVNQTEPDPDQGWGGLSTGKRIYLQSIGQNVTNHEIGHRVSADHGKAIVARNDANYHTYTWNLGTQAYEPYIPGVSPFTPTPFGAASYEYGNPFDTMGSGGGQFRLREKLEDLGWLTTTQVKRLDGPTGLGPGTYKIYAHNGLQATTNGSGDYGVVDTYNPTALYGITYNRPGQRFSTQTSSWLNETQVIDIEYRAGADGAAFYLNGALVDLDSEGGISQSSTERLLEVGKSIEDTAFGMSNFFAAAGAVGATPSGEDFLSFNPPPPTIVAGSWYHFSALGTGIDSIGSYIQLLITQINPLNGIVGDLNQDTFVNAADITLFVAGWAVDTSSMNSVSKYHHGDINLNGVTDLSDAFLMHGALKSNGISIALGQLITGVPEPGTLVLVGLAAIATLAGARRRA